jgi:hypothetical protein
MSSSASSRVADVSGDYYRTTFHPGRASTITSEDGA